MPAWLFPAIAGAASLIGKFKGDRDKQTSLDRMQKEKDIAYGGVADRFKGYGDRAAGVWQGNQDWGLSELGNMYGDIDSLVGYGARPGYRGEFDESKKWWQGITDTGWASPEQKDAGWGWGTFKNFADTGGWSPEEISDFRARASAGVPEMYGGLRNELMRGRTVQGGYGPGYNESISQLGRDRARSMAEASLGAETSLANSIRQGKMWGGEKGSETAFGELGTQLGGRRELDSIAQRIAEMNRSAGGGFSPLDAMRMKMGIIDQRTGLARQTGGEIPYGGVELSALGGRFAQPQQQQGPSFWDRMLGASGGALEGYAKSKGWWGA